MKKLITTILVVLSLIVKAQQTTKTVAHWKFTPEHTTGKINDGSLVIKDLAKNGNDLQFNVVKRDRSVYGNGKAVPVTAITDIQKQQLSEMFTWVDDVYGSENQKTLLFNTGAKKWDFGAFFETQKDAPLNINDFENGYTIEVIFKMPKNFTQERHKWTSIFRKKGCAIQFKQANTDFPYSFVGEPELLTGLAISNLKELQWFTYDKKPKEGTTNIDNQSNWSFSLADLEDWYHVTLINDGKSTKIYVNGVTDFRNANPNNYNMSSGILNNINTAQKPIFDNTWIIGATGYERGDKDGDGISEFPIDELFDGNIQEIRFTEGALPKENWLYANIQLNSTTKIGTNEDIELLTNEKNYNMVFVPDTQKPVRYMPEIVDAQMKWIADNHQNKNIIFTNFLGDLVDRWNQQYEWDNILKSLDYLKKSDAKFMTVDGNHDGYDGAFGDQAKNDNVTTYTEFFGPEYYEGKDYYFNQSPSRHAAYSIVRGGDYTYLYICVSFYQSQYLADLEWVQQVIKKYSYLPVIFSTHKHLNFEEDGSGVYRSDDKDFERLSKPENGGYSIEQLYPYFHFAWQRILKGNNNVFMAMSGHHHGAGYQISKNDFDNSVFEGVYDYQSDYHGGNGWMNFLEFDESNNKIEFRVFSPWVAQLPENERTYYDVKYRTQKEEYFTYSINFKERFNFYPWLTIEESLGSQILLNFQNTAQLSNPAVVIYKKGKAPLAENELKRVKINSTTNSSENKVLIDDLLDGDYYAVIREANLYTPISNKLEFSVLKLSNDRYKHSVSNVKVYPVPFDNLLTVFSSKRKITKFELYDVKGKMVKSIKGNNTLKQNINTSKLASGYYTVRLIFDKNKSEVYKVLKK